LPVKRAEGSKKMVSRLKNKHIKLLVELRKDGRSSLTDISRRISMPVSTIFDTMKTGAAGTVKKYTCLLNFEQIGFNCRTTIVLKVKKEEREEVKNHLLKQQCINSVYKINNGYDFLIEAVFKDMKGADEFTENLESKFKILEKKVYYIMEDIARELFMTDPVHAEMTGIVD
jgi:DNA-binding Lrp family transcriptional regulator